MTSVVGHQGFLEHVQQLNVLPVLSDTTKYTHEKQARDLATLLTNENTQEVKIECFSIQSNKLHEKQSRDLATLLTVNSNGHSM